MTRIIGQLCREWPVLLDERGHGCCARATPLLRGHVLAQPRGLARFTPGVAIAVGQILVIVRGRGLLVAVTLTLEWAERIQDGIEGGDRRVRGQDVELKMASTAMAGLGRRAARDASSEWSSRSTSWKKDSAMLASLAALTGSGASRRDTTLPKTARLAMVTESAP